MALPGLDSKTVYGHLNPALIREGMIGAAPIGNNDHFNDAYDQYSNTKYLTTNQLTNTNNLSSSFKSKLKSNEFRKQLKRRFSENVLGNLPTTNNSTNEFSKSFRCLLILFDPLFMILCVLKFKFCFLECSSFLNFKKKNANF